MPTIVRRTIHIASFSAFLTGIACGTGPVQNSDGQWSTQVSASDESGQSVANLTILAREPALLSRFEDGRVSIVPLLDKELLKPKAASDREMTYVEDPYEHVTFEVDDEQLAEGVSGFMIVGPNGASYRGYSTSYEYSTKDCATVERHAWWWWHNVYVSIYSKATESSSWDTLVSNYDLGNNDAVTRCDEGTYKLKVSVRARETDDFTVSFAD